MRLHLPRPQSIARRLTWMNIVVSGFALLLASLGFFAYDQYTFRENLVRNISAQAQIIGSNSTAALTFNDPQSAENTLSALASSHRILSAGLMSPNGKLFAEYVVRPSGASLKLPPLRAGQVEAHWFSQGELVLVRSIQLQGKSLGTVYIRSDLADMFTRLVRYVVIALLVFFLSLIAALFTSISARRSIADPIVGLAETARAVSRDENYSLRAEDTTDRGEIGTLIHAFNEMLVQIQQRDEALKIAQSDLERRVEERTRQLVASNRELEAFSYSVSHDLRGPLDVIGGFSYMLQNEYAEKLDASGRDYLQQLNAGAQRMVDLIEDLLDLSRVNSVAMKGEKVDLSGMARSIAAELKRREPARRVEFMIHDCVYAEGDARLLRIVLDNLLRNAWKYTSSHQKACIEFGCGEEGGRTVYFVRDDGAGFDATKASRLFKPFQRLHSAAEFPGTGIGLATVQRIINRHGGEIWAEGGIERGATFRFTLPPVPLLVAGC